MAQASVIPELEEAIKSRDPARRAAVLSSIADLFRNAGIQHKDDARLELFDDVFAQLVNDMAASALVKLSEDLTIAKVAPVRLIQQLAQHDAIEVARSILERSDQVTEDTLIQIVKTKSQEHLRAVAKRNNINEAVSDLLIERGNEQVIQTVTANAGAKISERSFGKLTDRFSNHEMIAANIARRKDVPPRVMKALMTKASDTVRTLILRSAPLETRHHVLALLNECLKPVDTDPSSKRVTAEARTAVIDLKAKGRLREDVLLDFAKKRMFGETVVALALVTALPVEIVESQMFAEQFDTLIIICKSVGLKWPTVVAILSLREVQPTPAQVDEAMTAYLTLSTENAHRAMRFFNAKQSILRQ